MRAVVFLALVLLSGCSAAGHDGAPDAPAPGVGVLRGVAVTQAIVPVEGVLLTLQPGGQTALTGAKGLFTFEGLAPGTYALSAQKAGYLPWQSTVEVRVGDDPDLVQLVLETDLADGRFYEAYKFQGFIDCSGIVLGVAFTAGLGGASGDGTISAAYPAAGTRVPEWVQSEMAWTPTQDLSRVMMLEVVPRNDSAPAERFAMVEGESPVLFTADRAFLEGDWGVVPGQPIEFIGFVGNSVPAPVVEGVGAAVQQPFSIYTHYFYGFRPPDGWRLTTDGEPLPPA